MNFKSFTSFSYQITLSKCSVDRSFKICNNGNFFHNDIESIKSIFLKNAYPPYLINNVIKKYLNYKFSSNQNQLKDTSISNLSHHIKLLKLCKEFSKENFLTLSKFLVYSKLKIIFPIPDDLKSFLVYKFTCTSGSSSYIGKKLYCHFKTSLEENIKKDIFKHLHSITTCFDSYNSLSFEIIDKTSSKFDLNAKLYIL